MTVRSGTATDYYHFLDQLDAALCSEGHVWGSTFAGAGNGTLTGAAGEPGGYRGGSASVVETITLTALDPQTFEVQGSESGALGRAVVGAAFEHPLLRCRINAGSVPFAVGDRFALNSSPPWTRLRRHGVRSRASRRGNLDALANLFDGATSTTATLPTARLPAIASIEQIGPAQVSAVTLGVFDTLNRGARDVELQWSDDGNAWTLAHRWSGITWATTRERRSFVVAQPPGEHVHWRVVITAHNGGTQLECNDLSFQTALEADYSLDTRGQVVWQAPGLDGTQQIPLGLELYEDAAAGIYNFNWYGFQFFAPQRSVRTQPRVSGLRNLPLAASPFAWWACIDGQRLIIVCRVGSVYVTAGAGLGLPYEPPSQHPFPYFVGACSNAEAGRVDATGADFRAFPDPGRYGLTAIYPDNNWLEHANRYASGSGDYGDSQTPGKTYPAAMGLGGERPYLRDRLDGRVSLLPIVLASNAPRHTWGEIGGLAWCSGFGLTSETLIEQDGQTWMAIQNTFRVAPDTFFALRMD